METAEREGAHYVLAQDPDSDRFSAAERRYDVQIQSILRGLRSMDIPPGHRVAGSPSLVINLASFLQVLYWTITSPREDHWVRLLILRSTQTQKLLSPDNLAMVASTVSSKMVEKMASVEGFQFVECLTG